ncbi:zinc-ribbon domain-containing protein [uncultured Maritimibacter sp.]|jgi:predicted Zn finger-like uncharacterized protein|uniref:zinc-ribbon domain-containing protein n=1 Tax=uncultured Maritimibacter sp. TaxID=991866 RepID=UPI000ACDB241|nr:zinc-ribbon domain-containing protein [uncultured Maritimibacter sp.]
MRLVCPNCGAQYEVDDRVIPEGGRDVQCSNCGNAWFQRPLKAGFDETDTTAPAAEPDDDDADGYDYADDPDDDPDEREDDGDEDPAFVPPAASPRRPIADDVRDILETEAQREIEARSREGVEVQEELGIGAYLDPEAERRRIARERMARMRGIEEGESLDPEVAPEPESEPLPEKRGREVFPDIEEINSTLDSPQGNGQTADQDEGQISQFAQRGSSGFRRGFSVMILLAALALAVYLLAPQIVDLVPASAGVLSAYVDWVNELFVWINAMMADAVARMESAAQGG